VAAEVRGACEILGLDPLFLANEGRFAAWVPESQADRALRLLQGARADEGAFRLGTVRSGEAGRVTARTRLGTARLLDMPSGELLPRIC
jgi:hydrogenase expression/formation protein HypE